MSMPPHCVILLHGITRTSQCMVPIERSLQAAGYFVLNMDYPSVNHRIAELTTILYRDNPIFHHPSNTTIHIVAHSMGCLIVRELLGKFSIANPIERIIMLAPPNHGSEMADFLKNNFLYQRLYGPAGEELTTQHAQSYPFPKLSQPFGVIAGNVCRDPISYWIMPKGNDGRVSIKSTHLDGMTDHIVLPSSHTLMLKHPETLKQIHHYLKKGYFTRHA